MPQFLNFNISLTKLKINYSVGLATFYLLNTHLLLVATVLDNADLKAVVIHIYYVHNIKRHYADFQLG